MNSKLWNAQAVAKADWAAIWGRDHGNEGVVAYAAEVKTMIASGKTQDEVLRSTAYAICNRVWYK